MFDSLQGSQNVSIHPINRKNKLGWAKPHLIFPLGLPMNFNMSKIHHIVAEISQFYNLKFCWRSWSFAYSKTLVGRHGSCQVKIWVRSNQVCCNISFFKDQHSMEVIFILSILKFWLSLLSFLKKYGRDQMWWFKFWFGPVILSLKLEQELNSGCWVIPLLLFWGRLPLKVIFIWSFLDTWLGLS